jgi:hypothetical protein
MMVQPSGGSWGNLPGIGGADAEQTGRDAADMVTGQIREMEYSYGDLARFIGYSAGGPTQQSTIPRS